MADALTQFLTWAVWDVIFFSNDIQTTTIAVAITSSLCCTIVIAVVHVMTLIRPQHSLKSTRKMKCTKTDTQISVHSKKCFSPVHVPCVRCGRFLADDGCRFVTCKLCCFSVLSCKIHQKKSILSKTCENKKTEMDLSSKDLQSCPDRLGFVGAQLTCLNLSDNSLHELPAEIGCLRGLQVLILHHNQLQSLPDTLVSLMELEKFDVSHNQLTEVSCCVPSMVNLTDLQMSHNQLSKIPPDVSRLKNLLIFDISFNRLESLCEELFTLYQLKVLNVSSNRMNVIPSLIGQMIKLQILDVSGCCISAIPMEIGNCVNLSCLKLANNKLQEIPVQLGSLGHLQSLELDNNNIQVLPFCLSFQENLILSVNGNPLLLPVNYSSFTSQLVQGPDLFPSLKELALRNVSRKHITHINTLPKCLQEILQKPSYCSKCGGSLFQFFASEIVPYHFLFLTDCIPLYKQLCSPHQPNGCG